MKVGFKFSAFLCPALGLELGAGQVTQFDKDVMAIQVGNTIHIIPRTAVWDMQVMVALAGSKQHPWPNMKW